MLRPDNVLKRRLCGRVWWGVQFVCGWGLCLFTVLWSTKKQAFSVRGPYRLYQRSREGTWTFTFTFYVCILLAALIFPSIFFLGATVFMPSNLLQILLPPICCDATCGFICRNIWYIQNVYQRESWATWQVLTVLHKLCLQAMEHHFFKLWNNGKT